MSSKSEFSNLQYLYFVIVYVVGRIECLEILFKSGTEVNCKDKKVSLCYNVITGFFLQDDTCSIVVVTN